MINWSSYVDAVGGNELGNTVGESGHSNVGWVWIWATLIGPNVGSVREIALLFWLVLFPQHKTLASYSYAQNDPALVN